MKGIKVYVSEEVEKRFRKAAMMTFGYGKGSLSFAAEKAFRKWVDEIEKTIDVTQIPEHPVEAIWGMLSHVDRSGVDLQHEARHLRALKMGY